MDKLHAAGCDGHWVAEMGHVLAPPTSGFDAGRPWLDLLAMENIFMAYNPDRSRNLVSLYRKTYPAPPHQWVGGTNIGYWRPEIAVYTPQHGTWMSAYNRLLSLSGRHKEN